MFFFLITEQKIKFDARQKEKKHPVKSRKTDAEIPKICVVVVKIKILIRKKN